MATKYLVSTTMGDSILEPGSKVYVQVSPSSYLRKNAVDINVGDMVLFEKPQAKTDLEDVDPHLTKSPRYALSKEMLHEKNSKGEFIPKLRTLLLKGLAERGVIESRDIHAKTLYETDDFTKEDYERMEEWLAGTLEKCGKDRSTQAIGNWLRGETLAPSDWEIFRVLEKEVNPQFADFRPYEEDPKSLYFNYELYVNIRRGIMRYLNECRGTTEVSEPRRQEKPHISLSPEYAIVFQHFINDRNDTQATARVTGIEKILKRPHLDHIIKTNKFLGEGVLKKEIENLKFLLKDYKDVLEFSEILEYYIESFIEDFDFEISPGDKIALSIKPLRELRTGKTVSDRYLRLNLSEYVLPTLLRYFGENLDDMILFLEKNSFDKSVLGVTDKKFVQNFVEPLRRAFLGREMDSRFGYSNGTALNLLESYYRVRKTTPKRVFESMAKGREFLYQIDESIRNKEISIIEQKMLSRDHQMFISGDKSKLKEMRSNEEAMKEEVKMIKDRYGIYLNIYGGHREGGLFFSEDIYSSQLSKGIDPLTNEPLPKLITGREYVERLDNRQLITKLKEIEEKNIFPGVFLIKKDHALKVLKEFNLGRILDRRWQDFVWEDV